MGVTNSGASAPLLERRDSGVCYLTLNRPRQRNPLNSELLMLMRSRLQEFQGGGDIKVIVIEANGPAFCSGHDLQELVDMTVADRMELFALCSELMLLIGQVPQPVIASVHGMATAAGCQLVASCDLAVAAKSAKFATPGVDIGLFCSTPAVALSRAVGHKQALRMLLTGEAIDARQALQVGLISDLVEDQELPLRTTALARLIAEKPNSCIATGKQGYYQQCEMSIENAYQLASAEMVNGLDKPAALEGIDAFLNKRKPQWPD